MKQSMSRHYSPILYTEYLRHYLPNTYSYCAAYLHPNSVFLLVMNYLQCVEHNPIYREGLDF